MQISVIVNVYESRATWSKSACAGWKWLAISRNVGIGTKESDSEAPDIGETAWINNALCLLEISQRLYGEAAQQCGMTGRSVTTGGADMASMVCDGATGGDLWICEHCSS